MNFFKKNKLHIKKTLVLATLLISAGMTTSRAAKTLKGTIVVKFKDSATPSVRKDIINKSGATGESSTGLKGAYSLKVPTEKTVEELIKYYSGLNEVEYAEPVYILDIFKLPGEYNDLDELKDRQWGLAKIGMDKAWDLETGTETVVAIVDTGIDLDHPELAPNIWSNPNASNAWGTYQSTAGINYTVVNDINGWDFVNHDNDPDDNEDHGTHCAGIVAGASQVAASTYSTVGVSWYNKLMAVKVMNSDGTGTSIDIANGIIHAAERGADVISLSLGMGAKSDLIEDAIKTAYDEGAFIVAATGNDSADSISYPAGYSKVFAVGASSNTDIRADFSNYGSGLDVIAPGTSIYSTVIGGYDSLDGTSMACPHVAGLASLVISQWDTRMGSSWSPEDISNAIVKNADDINGDYFPGWDKFTGYGRINAKKTLEYVTGELVYTDEKEAIAYPNPFNPGTDSVIIALPEDFDGSAETLLIYNLKGKKVRETGASGNTALWNGLDDNKNMCSSGLYFFAVRTTKDKIYRGKITLLR